MRERGTDIIEPYEPPEEPAYDWEYEDEPTYRSAPKILWGRLAVLGAFLLIAFFIGRATAGGGVPQDEYDEVTAQRNDARQELAAAEQDVADRDDQIAALQDEIEGLQATETPADTTGETTSEAPPEVEGEIYKIQGGDTLLEIAEEFYGDANLAEFIAEANGITDTSAINAGDEIIIPPEPEE